MTFVSAVYRFQQVSDIVYRRSKQQQQQQGDEHQEEEEAQSLDMWLLTDSTLAQLMDPQLAAPAVQFLVLEVMPCMSPQPYTLVFCASCVARYCFHTCVAVHASITLHMFALPCVLPVTAGTWYFDL